MKFNIKKLGAALLLLATLVLAACVTEETDSEDAKFNGEDSAVFCKAANGDSIKVGELGIGPDDCNLCYCGEDGKFDDCQETNCAGLEEAKLCYEVTLTKPIQCDGDNCHTSEIKGYKLLTSRDTDTLEAMAVDMSNCDSLKNIKFCYEVTHTNPIQCNGDNCYTSEIKGYKLLTSRDTDTLEAMAVDMSNCEKNISMDEYCELPEGGFVGVGESYMQSCNTCSCTASGYFMCTLMACEDDIPPVKDSTDVKACTLEYEPVCGKDEADKPQNYANRCELDRDNAEFIKAGECDPVIFEPDYPDYQPAIGDTIVVVDALLDSNVLGPYSPVCAKMEDGTWKEFMNAASAEASGGVVKFYSSCSFEVVDH